MSRSSIRTATGITWRTMHRWPQPPERQSRSIRPTPSDWPGRPVSWGRCRGRFRRADADRTIDGGRHGSGRRGHLHRAAHARSHAGEHLPLQRRLVAADQRRYALCRVLRSLRPAGRAIPAHCRTVSPAWRSLPAATRVYPGHGGTTTIGAEGLAAAANDGSAAPPSGPLARKAF